MKAVGITAEYNPFHNGHRYQIAEAKRLSGADKAVVIMSGSFVQRGEPACADKFTRTEWALDGGADMVIELPDVFALSCAERFASGAIRIMRGTGIIDSVCFGSETGSIDELKEAALRSEDAEKLAEALKSGLSYPAALAESTGSFPAPNDILGMEYVRAADKYFPEARLFCVKRRGGSYSGTELSGEFSSASAIRNAVSAVQANCGLYEKLAEAVPAAVLEELVDGRSGRSDIATFDGLSDAVLCRIRSMSKNELAALPEIAEGLENLFAERSLISNSARELLMRVKSKRYTMARLKRIAMNALLGITAELQYAASVNDEALYVRVLGIGKDSEEMLSELNKKARLPVIVRSSDREKLGELAGRVEAVSSLAHRIRALGQSDDKTVSPDASHRLIVR